MNRRLSVFLGIALLSAATAFAQESPGTEKPAAAQFTKPLLWKISSPGDGADSWLLGTIHLPRPVFSEFPSQIEAALKNSDGVYTEIPMDLATMVGLTQEMMLPNGETLAEKLSPDTIAELNTELKAISPSLDFEPLSRLKPWALATSLILLEDQMKYPGALAMDILLFQRAAMSGKEVGGIETPAEQIAIFEELTEEEQIAILEDTLHLLKIARDEGQSPANALAENYLAGDLAALTAELEKWNSRSENPDLTERFMERLLYHRNQIMAERIEKKLRAQPDFSFLFAVGAGHLDGDRGVLVLLEKAGFELTRIE